MSHTFKSGRSISPGFPPSHSMTYPNEAPRARGGRCGLRGRVPGVSSYSGTRGHIPAHGQEQEVTRLCGLNVYVLPNSSVAACGAGDGDGGRRPGLVRRGLGPRDALSGLTRRGRASVHMEEGPRAHSGRVASASWESGARREPDGPRPALGLAAPGTGRNEFPPSKLPICGSVTAPADGDTWCM